MKLSTYVDAVHDGVTSAASLADDQTRQIAGRLADAVDSSTRLALIQALSDAAAEISSDLAPGSVELRMSDGEPAFVVDHPREPTQSRMITPPESEATEGEDEAEQSESDPDEPMARISLRLPVSIKEKVDRAADEAGVSTNTWLTQAVSNQLSIGRQQTGWSKKDWKQGFEGLLGSDGPFGEQGPFGPHGVFGPDGPFGDGRNRAGRMPRPPRPPRPGRHDHPDTPGGRVQGWVR